MIKQLAWNTFKNTGNINTMMEILETDKQIKNKEMKENTNVNYKDQGDCPSTKQYG